MKGKTKAEVRFLHAVLAAVLIMAACFSLLVAPFVNYSKEDGSHLSGILLSAATWILVLGAAWMVQRTWRSATLQAEQDKGAAGRAWREGKIGWISFSQNPEAIVADVVLLAGIVLWVLKAVNIFWLGGVFQMLPYSLTFAGVLLHGWLNGKTYNYLRRKRTEERGRKG